MSVNLIINGATFAYPTQDDPPDWGYEATAWATAVTNALLPKTGGLFQLTGDLDFGNSKGIVTTYIKTNSPNPIATSGVLRFPQTGTIGWRNAANTSDINLGVNNLNQLVLNGVPVGGGVGTIPGGTQQLLASDGAGYFYNVPYGTSGQVMLSTGTGTTWVDQSAITSGGAVKVVGTLPVTSNPGDSALLSTNGTIYTSNGTTWTSLTGTVLPVSTLPLTGTAGQVVLLSTDSKLYRWTGLAWTAVVPAADISGQLVTTQLSDSAITSVKIAAGAVTAAKTAIAAIESTTGNLATGVVNTTNIVDSALTSVKLASGAVTAAKTAIAAIDSSSGNLTANSVTATNITAGAVVAGKIATDAVVASNIAAGSIVTAKLAAGAVTANEIAANTITAGNIAASTITSSQIAASTITGTNIAASTIATANLAAGAVTASKLSVTVGSGNMTPNSSFEVLNLGGGNRPLYWAETNSAAVSTTYTRPSGVLAGTFALGLKANANSAGTFGAHTDNTLDTATGVGGVLNGWTASTAYIVSFSARKVNGAGWTTMAVDANGATIGTTDVSNPVLTTAYQRYIIRVITSGTPPTLGYVGVRVNGSTATNDELHIDDFQVEIGDVATSWAPQASELLPGTIVANMVAANAITANSIAANAVTAGKIATDAVTAGTIAAGAVTAGKVAAGSISATELAADSVTAVKIAAGTVSADKMVTGTITAASGIIADAAITNAKIGSSITSSDFDGTINSSGIMTATGTRGWGIAKGDGTAGSGKMVLDAAVIRGNISASSITMTGFTSSQGGAYTVPFPQYLDIGFNTSGHMITINDGHTTGMDPVNMIIEKNTLDNILNPAGYTPSYIPPTYTRIIQGHLMLTIGTVNLTPSFLALNYRIKDELATDGDLTSTGDYAGIYPMFNKVLNGTTMKVARILLPLTSFAQSSWDDYYVWLAGNLLDANGQPLTFGNTITGKMTYRLSLDSYIFTI